mmetsp:Transcript_610/g.2148  ORF Transcript_610/g.2148 Transcript_610/m.2148 type:complete len:409 (-) Transcript_610:40-1266(-)
MQGLGELEANPALEEVPDDVWEDCSEGFSSGSSDEDDYDDGEELPRFEVQGGSFALPAAGAEKKEEKPEGSMSSKTSFSSKTSASRSRKSGSRSSRSGRKKQLFEHDDTVPALEEHIYSVPADAESAINWGKAEAAAKAAKEEPASWLERVGPACGKLMLLGAALVILLMLLALLALLLTLTGDPSTSSGRPTELPDNFTLYENSTLRVKPTNSSCSYERSCPDYCTEAVNEVVGCCKGCYLAAEGDCGLTVNVTYSHIPPSQSNEEIAKIYILVSNDGSFFWQTGWPVPVTNNREETLNGTGSAQVTDGCYGPPASVVIVGCLSTYDLTAKTFDEFPLSACATYWGYCTHLNDVWVAGVEGCLGPVWANNYRDSEDFIDIGSRLAPWPWLQLVGIALAIAASWGLLR